jgi:glycosyltransferase involved in cell wall biosynthesis
VSERATPEGSIDLLHVCFGGLGGHVGVVVPLDTVLHRRGLTTRVIRYAPREMLADATGWAVVPDAVVVEKRGRIDARGLLEIARLVRRWSPRVVLCHTGGAVGPVFAGQILSGRRPRIGLVEHQPLDRRAMSDQLGSLLALVFAQGVAVLTSEYVRHYPLAWVPSRKARELTLLPSGIDLESFSPSSSPKPGGAAGREMVIGITCRMVPQKDVDTLIRSIPLVQAALGADVAVRLRIAGDGPDRAQIEELIAQLGLGEVVELTGTLEEEAVISFLRDLDVYVQSTLGESGATAVLQAYAVGLAVVGSDVEGVRDVVRDGEDGVLVPGGDPAVLAQCLVALLDDDERRLALGRAARQRAEADFGAEPMAQRYLGFLEQINPDGPWRRALVAGR